ncbi:PREDICTED: TMV resistance protein N-like [Fragaria vesca subsp. vesca]|uniref:TMV resistance protein N-like n=1 Tax=Fragaria vesca subsp. vesca TaxID=101020 RepID=UPI0002C32B6F|nr:PREDICTED: TMV resistance protein N-like [Fragaria vesca subsp. vesca]
MSKLLRFRGVDTRNNIVSHLCRNLDQKGIKTFIDNEGLGTGDEISPALQKAIQESRISIVIFSENYASSGWCLEELVSILDCKESKQQLVYPVFYKVDPSDVRHQRGGFGLALAHHESRLKDNSEKVMRWREALTKASNLSGLHFINGSHESTFIDTIVERISAQLLDRLQLSVAKYPVGIEPRVEDVLKLLCVGEDDVRMVGIWGIGGIGKTTIAKGVYNSIAHNFEGSCFLENVRERSIRYGGLVELQISLLSKFLKEKELRITSVDEGITLIKERLCHKKVLLILDDVNDFNQLDKLVGKSDWFGSGSRIIITTRDKGQLTAHDVNYIYKMEKLSHHEALELFKLYAFKKNQNMDDYVELIDNLTLYAQGLPLALVVLGSHLRGRNVDQWKVALDGYATEPKKEIQEILRRSYDALDGLTKEIFLHIACFFNGKAKNYVIDILRGCDLNPEYGIEALTEKALISINEKNCILMHDLLEKMGKEIVCQESPTEPGERSRLWLYEDVYRVFMENTGSDKVRGIMLNDLNCRGEKIHLNTDSFSKMKNLQIFVSPRDFYTGGSFTGDHINYLSNELRLLVWDYCPLLSFPPSFYPKKLVVLRMHHSRQTSPLGEAPKIMQNLKSIDMSNSYGVRKISGLSMFPNLVDLNLSHCTNLVEVEVGNAKNLVNLNLSGCEKLQKFEIVEEMRSLKSLDLGRTGIKGFPSSIRFLINLEELRCDKLL